MDADDGWPASADVSLHSELASVGEAHSVSSTHQLKDTKDTGMMPLLPPRLDGTVVSTSTSARPHSATVSAFDTLGIASQRMTRPQPSGGPVPHHHPSTSDPPSRRVSDADLSAPVLALQHALADALARAQAAEARAEGMAQAIERYEVHTAALTAQLGQLQSAFSGEVSSLVAESEVSAARVVELEGRLAGVQEAHQAEIHQAQQEASEARDRASELSLALDEAKRQSDLSLSSALVEAGRERDACFMALREAEGARARLQEVQQQLDMVQGERDDVVVELQASRDALVSSEGRASSLLTRAEEAESALGAARVELGRLRHELAQAQAGQAALQGRLDAVLVAQAEAAAAAASLAVPVVPSRREHDLPVLPVVDDNTAQRDTTVQVVEAGDATVLSLASVPLVRAYESLALSAPVAKDQHEVTREEEPVGQPRQARVAGVTIPALAGPLASPIRPSVAGPSRRVVAVVTPPLSPPSPSTQGLGMEVSLESGPAPGSVRVAEGEQGKSFTCHAAYGDIDGAMAAELRPLANAVVDGRSSLLVLGAPPSCSWPCLAAVFAACAQQLLVTMAARSGNGVSGLAVQRSLSCGVLDVDAAGKAAVDILAEAAYGHGSTSTGRDTRAVPVVWEAGATIGTSLQVEVQDEAQASDVLARAMAAREGIRAQQGGMLGRSHVVVVLSVSHTTSTGNGEPYSSRLFLVLPACSAHVATAVQPGLHPGVLAQFEAVSSSIAATVQHMQLCLDKLMAGQAEAQGDLRARMEVESLAQSNALSAVASSALKPSSPFLYMVVLPRTLPYDGDADVVALLVAGHDLYSTAQLASHKAAHAASQRPAVSALSMLTGGAAGTATGEAQGTTTARKPGTSPKPVALPATSRLPVLQPRVLAATTATPAALVDVDSFVESNRMLARRPAGSTSPALVDVDAYVDSVLARSRRAKALTGLGLKAPGRTGTDVKSPGTALSTGRADRTSVGRGATPHARRPSAASTSSMRSTSTGRSLRHTATLSSVPPTPVDMGMELAMPITARTNGTTEDRGDQGTDRRAGGQVQGPSHSAARAAARASHRYSGSGDTAQSAAAVPSARPRSRSRGRSLGGQEEVPTGTTAGKPARAASRPKSGPAQATPSTTSRAVPTAASARPSTVLADLDALIADEVAQSMWLEREMQGQGARSTALSQATRSPVRSQAAVNAATAAAAVAMTSPPRAGAGAARALDATSPVPANRLDQSALSLMSLGVGIAGPVVASPARPGMSPMGTTTRSQGAVPVATPADAPRPPSLRMSPSTPARLDPVPGMRRLLATVVPLLGGKLIPRHLDDLRTRLAGADLQGKGSLDDMAFAGALRDWLSSYAQATSPQAGLGALPLAAAAGLLAFMGLDGAPAIDYLDFADGLESLAIGDRMLG